MPFRISQALRGGSNGEEVPAFAQGLWSGPADDLRYNGSTMAFGIRVDEDGTRSGQRTPICSSSGTCSQCRIDFPGSGTGLLGAAIRVQPA